MTTPDYFSGFDQARHTLWCYEARSHVYLKLSHLPLRDDDRIRFIHVDHVSRLDRMKLTAFDTDGNPLGVDTLYNDDGLGMEPVSDFHVRPDTLRFAVNEDGWVLDADCLRRYDLVTDRERTQRAMFLALLEDMVAEGDARYMLFSDDMFGLEATAVKPDSGQHN